MDDFSPPPGMQTQQAMPFRSGTPDSVHSTESDAVRVILRCRPMNESERARQDDEIVRVVSNKEVELVLPGAGGRSLLKHFRFNNSVDPSCKQSEFFEVCGIKQLIDSALNGYAATVFAYGQTGSGKTYSMSGMEERIAREEWSGGDDTDGLIPRSIRFIYEEIERLGGQTKYTIRASYCEIYNEQVYDLLNYTSGALPIRWNVKNGFFVQDLFVVECDELADVMAVVSEGHRNRRVGSHELNKDSSRSHSLLTVHIESEYVDPEDGHSSIKYGKIVFVDLAGSERLKDTKSDGILLTETGAINKSLFTLSKVISALSDKKNSKQQQFIPYRDSKLTKLLMDSLGGNALTLMVACCSPSSQFTEETLSTLNYATRAKCIKNKPTIQMDPKEQLIYSLKQEVKLLRMENAYLKQQLGTEGSAGPAFNNNHRAGAAGGRMGEPPPGLGGGDGRMHNRHSNSSEGILPSSPSTQLRKFSLGVPPTSNMGNVQPMPPIGGPHQHAAPPGLPTPGNPSPRQQRGVADVVGTNSKQTMEMQAILSSYQGEVDRLKHENKELRTHGSNAERSYRSVMAENERLCSKLEHLEEIFVHRGKQSQWPVEDQEKQIQDENATTEQKKQDDSKMLKVIKGLTSENETLKKRIKIMEHSIMQSATRRDQQELPLSPRARAVAEAQQNPQLASENAHLHQQIEVLQRALLEAKRQVQMFQTHHSKRQELDTIQREKKIAM